MPDMFMLFLVLKDESKEPWVQQSCLPVTKIAETR